MKLTPSGSRDVNPLFDVDWYVRTYSGSGARSDSAWAHYQNDGVALGLNPNPFFDVAWYRARYPDVAIAGAEPLEHYCRWGAAEGRDPGPSFSTSGYLAAYPEVASMEINPLLHYLLIGVGEGRTAPTVLEFAAQELTERSTAPPADEDQPDIQVEVSHGQMAELLAHTTAVWKRLGNIEPHWSVLSAERYRAANVASSLAEFEATGQHEVAELLRLLEAHSVDVSSLASVIEYGCGVGRVTRWLAKRFQDVYAYDVSASHLEIARASLAEHGCRNVETIQVHGVDSLRELPKVDLIYSFLVLQHNTPPVMSVTLRHLLQAIRPGGVALFQLPTHGADYSFSVSEYIGKIRSLKSRATFVLGDGGQGIEMHVLPESFVHRLIDESGCRTLEIIKSTAAGPGFVSSTFMVQRPAV